MVSVDIILATDIDFSYVFAFSILIDTFIEASLEVIEVTVIVLLSGSNLAAQLVVFNILTLYSPASGVTPIGVNIFKPL